MQEKATAGMKVIFDASFSDEHGTVLFFLQVQGSKSIHPQHQYKILLINADVVVEIVEKPSS